MHDEWQARVEAKLDRIAETQARQIAYDESTRADVEDLKKKTIDLKETQDKQKGAVNLVVVMSFVATIFVAIVEGAKYFK